jgi:hypothetical protein
MKPGKGNLPTGVFRGEPAESLPAIKKKGLDKRPAIL